MLVVGAGGDERAGRRPPSPRRGAAALTIVNRTLARRRGWPSAPAARPGRWPSSSDALAGADVVISCTGATGVVVDLADVAGDAQAARAGRPQVYVDLALPHDVDPGGRRRCPG